MVKFNGYSVERKVSITAILKVEDVSDVYSTGFSATCRLSCGHITMLGGEGTLEVAEVVHCPSSDHCVSHGAKSPVYILKMAEKRTSAMADPILSTVEA